MSNEFGTLGHLKNALGISQSLEDLSDETKVYLEFGGLLQPLTTIRSSFDANNIPVFIISADEED